MSKHKRLPNGFGQITKLNNKNLRNPYRAMITVGKTELGKPIQKILKPKGYFKTYNDAYTALLEYHQNPYDVDKDITLADLYDKWSNKYFQEISPSASRSIVSAWARISILGKYNLESIRTYHLKELIDQADASPNMKSRMKSTLNLMFDYAVEYELVDRNPARAFSLSKNVVKDIRSTHDAHIVFTDGEIETLWQNINFPFVEVVLFQIYGGWRPQELGLIETENVNLEQNIIIGGMKTDAGTNRIVPIHPAILDLAKKYKSQAESRGDKYLFSANGKLTYDKYRHRFAKIVKALDLKPEHKAHDGRKTFITLAKKYGVDEYAIKYIAGHAITDLTERVYTERNTKWLKDEITKIPSPSHLNL